MVESDTAKVAGSSLEVSSRPTSNGMRLYWLIAAFILAALLAGIHLYALPNFWYWYYPWLDLPVHLIGGALMATAVIGVLGPRFRPLVFLIIVAAGAVGWELFELMINYTREANFVLDTSFDLLMDTLGITVSYAIARLTIWR